MRDVGRTLLVEANAVSDNPLVFAGRDGADDEVLSGGNFHAEPVALAADHLALAIAEIGALSERRIALMMDANLSGLPPFLVADGGVNSGFMIAQVTAAALAAENRALATPRSVDSLPTSANQEDHVSMATNAALRLLPMAGHTAAIVAVELLAAAQGVELRARWRRRRAWRPPSARSAPRRRSGTATGRSRPTSRGCARGSRRAPTCPGFPPRSPADHLRPVTFRSLPPCIATTPPSSPAPPATPTAPSARRAAPSSRRNRG